MNTDFVNFRAWYADTLEILYGRREAGLVVFIISLPLLERYLRQKNNLGPSQNLEESFMLDLQNLFPSLSSVQIARQFWNTYRNGFLHQATLSMQTKAGAALPTGWLSHDEAKDVAVCNDGIFSVNPVKFCKKVIETITSDFSTFLGAGTSAPPLPTITHNFPPGPPPIPPGYIGTRGGP